MDREMTISAAGSRKAASWPQQRIWWSELAGRLARPARGKETLEQYLRLPKARQDDLKDTGGYVGGAVEGRRTAGNVRTRELVALDLDSLPKGGRGAEAALERAASLGVAYAAHSTRRHSPGSPRLRVLFPLDRPVSADEYEPIARKCAESMGIESVDAGSYEASRLMHWPSVCAGAEFLFREGKGPFLSADGALGLYADWRDASQWPRAPGELEARRARVERLEDPALKKGAVGAFCRAYDVPRAMAELLPGAYLPHSEGRWTYSGGSTSGGAVLYGGGKWLYSHHATDPCGGREVNAFDLVRLHRFGALDGPAPPGAPANRLPSYKEMVKLALGLPEVAALVEQERGESILEDFGADLPEAAEGAARFLGGLEGKAFTTEMCARLLEAAGIEAWHDEISKKPYVEGFPQEWSRERAAANLPVRIADLLRVANVRGAGREAIHDALGVVMDERRRNPVAELLESTRWDGADRVSELLGILRVRDPFSRGLVAKWLTQCAAMACNDAAAPWGAEGALVLAGAQGVGKTSFFREIVPEPRWFREGAAVDFRDKDTLIAATSCWICELGELDRTTRRDESALKAFLTAATDNVRAPYARQACERPRRASFCGTVNPDRFLADETGSRRFWTVGVESVDLGRLFALAYEWKAQLWAQVHEGWRAGGGFRLTAEERAELEARNAAHQKHMDFELEVRELLDWGLPEGMWGEFTAVEVAKRLAWGQAPPANRVGRALAYIARQDARVAARVVHGRTLYRLPMARFPADAAGGAAIEGVP